jgi:hypothetical protein
MRKNYDIVIGRYHRSKQQPLGSGLSIMKKYQSTFSVRQVKYTFKPSYRSCMQCVALTTTSCTFRQDDGDSCCNLPFCSGDHMIIHLRLEHKAIYCSNALCNKYALVDRVSPTCKRGCCLYCSEECKEKVRTISINVLSCVVCGCGKERFPKCKACRSPPQEEPYDTNPSKEPLIANEYGSHTNRDVFE